MLDLFRSRDTAMRYLLIVLLSLVALSMIITLVPGFGSASSSSTDATTMATVCGEKITAQQISQLVQMQIRNREMSPEVAELAVPQMVNQMIGEMATSCQATKMGLAVSNEEVAGGIRMLIPMLWQNGEFAGKEAYSAYLQRMNTNIPQFESRVRQNLLLEKLQRVAFDGIVVSPAEVVADYKKKYEKARVDVVKLDPEEIRKTIVPTRAEMEAEYAKNKARYMVPAQLAATLLIADSDKMGTSLAPPDADLQKAYQANIARYKTEDRVKTRHILLKSDSTTSKDDDLKAKAKAQDILNQIKAGGNFAALAKAHSQDPGSGSKGGDLDFYPRGQLDKAYEEAAYSLKPNETSGLVKSQFGYHIIQTIEKELSRTKPFEEVKAELLADFRRSQLVDRIPQIVEQARGELIKSPGQAEQIAQKFGLEIRRVEKWTGGGEFPLIGRSQELDFALGSQQKGGVTEALELPNSRMVIGVVDNLAMPRQGELAEVEDRVKASLIETKGLKAVEDLATSLDAKLKANGNDLKKAAAELSLKVTDSGDFDRTGQMPNLTGAFFGEQPFSNPVGFVASKFRIGSALFFWKITSRTAADVAALDSAGGEKDRKLLVDIIRERKLRERRDLFEEGLVRQLTESGSISKNEEAIKRFAGSYRRG